MLLLGILYKCMDPILKNTARKTSAASWADKIFHDELGYECSRLRSVLEIIADLARHFTLFIEYRGVVNEAYTILKLEYVQGRIIYGRQQWMCSWLAEDLPCNLGMPSLFYMLRNNTVSSSHLAAPYPNRPWWRLEVPTGVADLPHTLSTQLMMIL